MRHHGRFYIAAAIGALGYVIALGQEFPLRVLLAGDLFFGSYLAMMLALAVEIKPDGLRRRAAVEDEGALVILFLTAVAVVFSLAATFLLINRPHQQTPVVALLAVASVPVSWTMVHTLAAFHYAKLFYAPTGTGKHDAGGLTFPDTPEPGALDFAYYSFVIGMTAQVSDVVVTSHVMRQTTLVHGIVSFFYNTVLIAISVNAAISLAG